MILANNIDDLSKPAEHFEDALAFCRKAGYWSELAWTGCDYPDMLREGDADGDRAKGIGLLDQYLAITR